MDLANLGKFASIKKVDPSNVQQMKYLFFVPSEELQGGNIFSRLASNYKVIQPFLDAIDSEFIEQMN